MTSSGVSSSSKTDFGAHEMVFHSQDLTCKRGKHPEGLEYTYDFQANPRLISPDYQQTILNEDGTY